MKRKQCLNCCEIYSPKKSNARNPNKFCGDGCEENYDPELDRVGI